MGLFLSSGCFRFADSFLFGAGKAVFRPVACDQVRGARGRGQGTETGGLSDGACLSVEVRGELAIGAHFRAAHLYSVGPFGS